MAATPREQTPTRPLRNDLTIYDAVAAQWWSDDLRWVRTLKNMVPARLRWFDRRLAEAGLSWEGARALDLGCAGGFMAEALDDRGAQVSGIDPAADAVAAARAHAAQTGRAIRYDVGVGEALPYEDGAFDVVVCVDVLEHVDDVRRVLAEVARVLRPGGLFLFDTINRTLAARLLVVSLAEDVLGLLPKGAHDPALFIRPAEMKEMLAAAGFAPGAIAGLGPVGIDRRGDFRFGRAPSAAVIYMGVARAPGAAAGAR
ncbi:MAG: bifunctional 2-polyprenyl-6-hydroxyphenol methylase/3-demethylubiquinol 3-O-methyltransferase UbiG [Pseudomonadota bacterium]